MAKISTLKDGFEDGVIDTGLWVVSGTGGTVTETGGKLVFVGTTGNRTITSVDSYDLTGSGVYVKMERTGTGNYATLRVADPSNDRYQVNFVLGAALMYFQANVVGNIGGGHATDGARRWIRIRESGGTMFFDTADEAGADPPTTWTNRADHATRAEFDPTSVKLVFLLEYEGTETTTTFDGLNAATTFVPDPPPTPGTILARGLYL